MRTIKQSKVIGVIECECGGIWEDDGEKRLLWGDCIGVVIWVKWRDEPASERRESLAGGRKSPKASEGDALSIITQDCKKVNCGQKALSDRKDSVEVGSEERQVIESHMWWEDNRRFWMGDYMVWFMVNKTIKKSLKFTKER